MRIGSSVVLIGLVVLGCQPQESGVGDDVAAMTALADEYVRSYYDRFPDAATGSGYGDADHGRLRDNSLAAVREWQTQEDAWLDELKDIDGSRFEGTPAYVPYAFLKELLEASIGFRLCRMELWNVSPTWTGWQNAFAFLASLQPVGTGRPLHEFQVSVPLKPIEQALQGEVSCPVALTLFA